MCNLATLSVYQEGALSLNGHTPVQLVHSLRILRGLQGEVHCSTAEWLLYIPLCTLTRSEWLSQQTTAVSQNRSGWL